MESTRTKSKPNPREKVNFVSVLLWWWTIDIFKTGYRKILTTEDLFEPLQVDRSNLLGDRLEKQWQIELKKSKERKREPSLLRAISRTFLWEYSILGLIHMFNEFIIRLSTPLLLGGLLQYFRKNSEEPYENALMYATGICLATAVNVINSNQLVFGAFHVGAKIRAAVCSVIYRKALRLSKTALGETAPGKVINLLANDVNRFEYISVILHYMWSAPLSALFVGYILYHEAGYAGLIGIAVVFTVMPTQSYTSKLLSKFRLQTAIKIDERVRLMDEIISGVQVIKMYAWEKPFCALIELARKLELRVAIKSAYIRGIYLTFNIFTTRMALYCTLVTLIMLDSELPADKVFILLSYFNVLSHVMCTMFVRGIAEISEGLVAVQRLQSFLMNEEVCSSDAILSNELSVNGVNGSFKSKQIYNEAFELDSSIVTNDKDVNNRRRSLDEKITGDGRKQNRSIVDDVTDSEKPDDERKLSFTRNDSNRAIEMINVTAKWETNKSENILEELNLEIKKSKLYAVIGTVGSGKSSFLSAILGEISLMEGQVNVNGSISYASQDAWVFGSTVRQNIIFGQNYDRQRYQKVVKACALLRDFEQFPQGDQTIVGERGSSLSGGQKARLNLARALYRQSDIYLLDDPLSAVDAHISKHLFQECIQRYLAGRTRILATHQLQYIKEADGILLLEQGRMKYFVHYQDLLRYRPEYGALLMEENVDVQSIEMSAIKRQFSSSSTKNCSVDVSDTEDEEESQDAEKLKNGLEETSRGTVKNSIFIKYFQTGVNLYRAFFVLLLFVFTQFTVSFNDYFVPLLINAEETRHYIAKLHNNNITDASANVTSVDANLLSVNTYIYIYTSIVLSIFLAGNIRSLCYYKMCMTCSQRLHDMMFSALIRTRMLFFDTNPSGRILNRFSKDMGAIDELLPKAILDASYMNLMIIGSLIVASMVNPLFLIPIAFISIIFYFARKVYIKTSKNIKRLEGITRSPVFTQLNATLNGLATIRAYCAQNILKEEFDKVQNLHTSAVYMFIVTTTAFAFFLDIFCFALISLIIFSFLLLNESFSGGEVGLAITQVIAITGYIQFGMRQNAEVTNQLMAVERVLEYIQLPPEPNLKDRGLFLKKKTRQNLKLPADVPKTWPARGCIKFKNVHMRYVNEEPPVLKELNLVVHSGEKVGVVGRTGAGKSSLISAVFRLAKVDGIIEIDGIDTGMIALENLRRKISIIPQDPVLFSGTLRRNLDPFDEYSDQELWEVLEEVELKNVTNIVENGLESRVLDRGSNYSVGQRQLVCLARAILRNNRILMLDEATANVDPYTDALIQRTIRKKFAICTMFTVAHRLNTIMDSDKILVMDKGRMSEYDHPHILLQNEHSLFTALVKETGRAMHDQLANVAKQSYIDKHGETR